MMLQRRPAAITNIITRGDDQETVLGLEYDSQFKIFPGLGRVCVDFNWSQAAMRWRDSTPVDGMGTDYWLGKKRGDLS